MTSRRSVRRSCILGVGCCALLAALLTMGTGQAIAADRVVVGEQFTATWCGYCPPVRAAYSDLLDGYPDRFAGMQIHGGDAYATSWGNSRMSFYSVTGYPTTVQDGFLKRSGAPSASQIPGDFTSRKAVTTDVTIQLSGTEVSSQRYEITAKVGLEATGTAKTVRVYMVQVLDNYPSGSDYRNCFIQAAAYQTVSLTPGNSQNVTAQFNFTGASWTYKEDITILVWAQKTGSFPSGSEIYQAAITDYPFMTDCNGNGIPDEDDIANCDGSLWCRDCNGNEIPDGCEPGGDVDCDGNGDSDLCDIYFGVSLDCNDNAVPDECDVEDGTSQDCNTNGVPDECDIADGTSEDCNLNGVPDECDLDCDANGLVDECEITADPSLDCNHNGNLDYCDLRDCDGSPWCDDCNNNGVMDYCDILADFAADSPIYSPIGTAYPQQFTLVAPPEAVANVTLTFNAKADIRYTSEYIDVDINGTDIGTLYTGTYFACEPDQIDVIVLTPEVFNAAMAGGDAVITMTPSAAVHPLACSGDNHIQVSVAYIGLAASQDADGDGIPDECQGGPTPCAGDMNCDGVVNYNDIDAFVAALSCVGGDPSCWDPACPWLNGDCNGDDSVTYADIDAFVARIGATCD